MASLSLLAGMALLILGAEILVRGASRLAASFGISPLIIGLTIVAFGTSAPEFAVSLKASLSGQAGIALGNVVGSNIFNVLFILGASALIAPLVVSQQLIRLDVPLMIGASLLALLFSLDGTLSLSEGAALFSLLLGYTGLLLYLGKKGAPIATGEAAYPEPPPAPGRRPTNLWHLLYIVAGLMLLVTGSRLLVQGAITAARMLGVSELVIGLTIVAVGTSLPEVVTSIVASVRGAREIAVGNVVGSNLFNLLGVLGLTAIVAPGGIDVLHSVITFDLPVMLAVAFACLPIFFTGGVISRWEGALLLGYYAVYMGYVILQASSHDALPAYSRTMLYFVLPLTAVTLLVVVLQGLRRRR